MPIIATRASSTDGTGQRPVSNHSRPRPIAAATGMPWMLPDGLVSGVLRSPCASIHSIAPGAPAARARPPSTPIASEWSPPSTSGNSPARVAPSTASARWSL